MKVVGSDTYVAPFGAPIESYGVIAKGSSGENGTAVTPPISLADASVVCENPDTAIAVIEVEEQIIDLTEYSSESGADPISGGSLELTSFSIGMDNDRLNIDSANQIIGTSTSQNKIFEGNGEYLSSLEDSLSVDLALGPPNATDLNDAHVCFLLGGNNSTASHYNGASSILATAGSGHHFVINAVSRTQTCGSVEQTNSDSLELAKILSHTTVDAADLSSFFRLDSECSDTSTFWRTAS